ncbi:alpha/beta fold hydrolase [Kutzneria chonburiensis]|uniref:Alpha/beta fold hydrolase n=1 Tax=Kutzneria chonburiensis TaxID=1483604 RepID=A0ABV6MMG1_9PSEU|nr:alpha/beta fold hydrolase [Kutzneria chonburiensis]
MVDTVTLPGGEIAYTEQGAGRAVVFIHGLLVNANLWRKVIPLVADAGFRCVAPTLPLGAHQKAMPDADLTPPGLAKLIADFLEALDLDDVTIVANDSGGALTQVLMVNHPEHVGRVVLTPCDAFEDFFPKPFDALTRLIRKPGVPWLLSRALQLKAVQQQPNSFGWLAKRGIPDEIMASYVRPCRDSAAIRRDLKRFLVGVDNRHTLAAAERLPGFEKPVLLVRATEDKVFKAELFERLTTILPDARLVDVADSWTFVSEDQPDQLARLVVEFAR